MAGIVAEAFPDGEVTIVEGGVEAATALLACPFNHIFYIGNNTVGRIIMRAAAEHFASVTLEMGGKNPSIVDASADVEDAALKTSWGRMCNGGQACIAPRSEEHTSELQSLMRISSAVFCLQKKI